MRICVFDRATVWGDDLPMDALLALGEVRLFETVKPEEVASVIGGDEAVLCNKTPMTRAVMDACPNLKYIGVMATGVNNVDLDAAREKGIRVTNIPGYSTTAVAQLAMANILEFATSLSAYNESTARGDWQRASAFTYFPFPLMELDGKTRKVPVVDETRCIGCGACENLCPARPYSGIYVEGYTIHNEI